MGIFSKLKQAWFGDVNWEKLDDEFFDNLEESLILADVGVNIAAESVNSLRNAVFSYDMKDPEQVKAELRKILLQKLSVGETALESGPDGMHAATLLTPRLQELGLSLRLR